MHVEDPDDFLIGKGKMDKKETFRKRYWALWYYYEYQKSTTGKEIHTLKEIGDYITGKQRA